MNQIAFWVFLFVAVSRELSVKVTNQLLDAGLDSFKFVQSFLKINVFYVVLSDQNMAYLSSTSDRKVYQTELKMARQIIELSFK